MTLSSPPPTVAVFMPVYNHAAFLRESIDSVLTQDYPNFHLYIGDDASTDESPSIIKDHAERYPDKISYYINDKNMGITGNCNKLMALCDGDYVAFTAGDDLFLPGKLSRQVDFMNAHPNCVASYTNARIFGEGMKPTRYYGFFPKRRAYEVRNGDIEPSIKHRHFMAGCTIMARRKHLPQGFYNPEISIMSDWLFFVEVASCGDILYIDEVLSCYRRHTGNVTWRYTDIADFEKTYAIMERKFPAHSKAIQSGRARLYISYTIYHVMKRQWGEAKAVAGKAKKAITTGGPSVLLFALRAFFADCFRYTYRLVTGAWRL